MIRIQFYNKAMNNDIQGDNNDSNGVSTTKTVLNTTIPSKSNVEFEEISEGIFKATTQKSKYIIEYDISKCIGAASCAVIAANTFFMNEENKAEILKDSEDFDDDDIIMEAAQSCPVFAIKIIDKASGEILFPLDEY